MFVWAGHAVETYLQFCLRQRQWALAPAVTASEQPAIATRLDCQAAGTAITKEYLLLGRIHFPSHQMREPYSPDHTARIGGFHADPLAIEGQENATTGHKERWALAHVIVPHDEGPRYVAVPGQHQEFSTSLHALKELNDVSSVGMIAHGGDRRHLGGGISAMFYHRSNAAEWQGLRQNVLRTGNIGPVFQELTETAPKSVALIKAC
jgi:hypothetical protein